MTDASKFINYGDYIYVHSAEVPKSYLSARSILEEKVFFIRSPPPYSSEMIEEIDSTFYENQGELVFALYPKLNYQAYKNFTKLKPNDDPFKVELLKKRLDVELDQNQKLIDKMMGTPVTFGSEIQLLHVSSNSFIRATREKNPIKNELYELRLSKKGGSGMYFKIIPYLSFKKEGERISLKDYFYLENTKLQAAIVYKNIPKYPYTKGQNTSTESDEVNFESPFTSQAAHRNYVPLMELSSTFEKYEAGLKQQDLNCPLGVRLILPQKHNYTAKTLTWGSYVRLKFMLNTKQTGYFYSDHTIIGGSPDVYCRIVNTNNIHERESFQAIFQIIPISEDLYGTPILFEDSKEIFIRLRHLLTGRYLQIGSEKLRCCLSESLDTFLANVNIQMTGEASPKRSSPVHSRRRRNSQIRKERSSYLVRTQSQSKMKILHLKNQPSQFSQKAIRGSEKSGQPTTEVRKDDSPVIRLDKLEHITSQYVKPESNSNAQEGEEKNEEEEDKNVISKFFEKTSIRLRNASQDDEGMLTSDSVFALESIQLDQEGIPGSLTVNPHDKEDIMNQVAFTWMKTAAYADDENIREYFKPRFHVLNPLDKEEFEAQISSQNNIFFHFAAVGSEEISEIMAIHSRLYPLINLSNIIGVKPKDISPKAKPGAGRIAQKRGDNVTPKMHRDDDGDGVTEGLTKNLNEATDAIRKFSVWLGNEDPMLNTGNLTLQVKQKMARELGLVDILLDLLMQLYTRSLLKTNTKTLPFYKFLTQDIFNLLQAIIRKNRANNIYIFQWSKLLEDMTLHPRIPNDLGVDKLLSQIFYENITQIDELKEIPAHLDFSDFDLKALNIAIALYRYNPIRPSEEKDRIIETLILRDDNRKKIFPSFEQDEDGNIMVLDEKKAKILRVEPALEYKDKKLFDFCTGVINLATEITRSKPQVVYSYLQNTIPVKLCINLFENRKWNYLFRSALLDLFTELYVSVESVFIDDQVSHSKIKLLNNVSLPDDVRGLFDSRKKNFLINFVNEEFNIKRFISDFLTDKHKWTDDEHKYVHSVFKLVHAMCRKGCYEDSDLLVLKQALYSYLQVGLATIHAEISPEAKPFDMKIDLNAEIKIVEKKEKVRQKKTELMEKPKRKLFSLRKGSVLEKAKTDRGKIYEQANEEPEVEEEEIEEVGEKGDPYWKKVQTSEMITWMNEALKIIEYIEIREMDKVQKDFFKHEETLKFFNEKLLSNNDAVMSSLSPETIAQIKQDKEAYALSYINNNLVMKDCKNQLLLIELLLIKNPILTSQIVHLLYLSFSKQKDFLNALNNIQVIYPENLETYCFYLKLVDTLRLSKVRLDALYGSKTYLDGVEIYQTVDSALKELLDDLHLLKLLSPSSQEEFETPSPLPNPTVPVYEIYDEYRFESTKGREKQNLLRNLSYFQTVTELFIPLTKGQYCKDHSIRERHLASFLHFYAYLCVNNPTNQKLMTDNQEFLKALLSIEYPGLQPLLLRVVSEMYRDNFSLLIQISQNSQNIITLLLNKFFQRFSYEELTHNEFFIMCLRVFPTFFQIKNNFLTQNQVYFAKQFYSKVLEKPDQHNINNILTMKLYRFLSTNKLENHTLDSDPHCVKVPFEISFAIYFLNTFSMMVAGNSSSNSVACLTNKYYLSIKDIYVLLKAAGDWYNLKLALVTFLNNVYIKNKKLEDNELTELYNIVRECMFEELNEYNRFLRNRHLYARSHHQRFVSAFDAHYPIVTEFTYKEVVDEVYHQYILHGVMDTFLFYALRLKSNPSENDHAILDDYVSSSLAEVKEFWQPGPNAKRNFQLDMEMVPMKNNMLVPIDEPSDADMLDGDLLVPQLNERKKANQLQKDIKRATASIRKKEKVRAFKVFPTEYVNWLGKTSVKEQLQLDLKMIETKHNMELEILVKILLHIRLENPKKFHIVMQSFMNVLGDEDGPNHIKQAALNVIRKLSNFKANAEIYEKIQMDLVQLKFIDFFDDVIVYTKNEEDRLEFLLAMIDFLDEASLRVQQELYASLYKDEQNLYLETIKKFILSNFEDFRENEKNFADDGNKDDQYNAKSVVYKKMYRVIYALEMLRLSCENHFEPMQHYLREQVQANGRNKKSINFINLISDIFNRYTKSINEKNAVLGLKILDTLTEMLQGPCIENQVALCNAKILENLEDLIVEVNDIRKKKESLVWTEMNNKILILISAILEGSSTGQLGIQGSPAAYIVGQVSIHINASFFLERMEEIYNNVYKQRKKAVWKNTKIKHKDRKAQNSQALVMSLAVLEAELVKQESYKHPEGAYKAYINEGVQFGIVLYTLAHLSPDIRTKVEEFKNKIKEVKVERYKEIQRAEMFYHKQIGQVEIVNKKGELERIYFPIIDKIKYLSSVTKDKFLDEVNRESANEKLFGLVRHSKLFEDEMNHFEKLRRNKLKLSLTYFSRLRDLNLLIAFATNIIILFESQIASSLADFKGNSAEDRAAAVQEGHDDANRLIKVLGIVHIGLCSLVLIFWGIFQAPLDINKSFRELETKGARDLANKDQSREKNWIKQAYEKVKGAFEKVSYMLFDTYLTYLILFLLFAVLGTSYSKVFFGFLLFDLIDRSVILNNVIKSVTVNYKQLLMTAVLGILIMYVYAVLGFFAVLNGEIAEEVCDSVFHCFLFMSDNALRAGGGVGDALSGGSLPALEAVAYTDRTNYERRYFYDLFYFLIIIIMLLNIIFGIIIDTFADLRDQKTLKDFDEKNQCFICNLERTAFEKKGESFEVHTKSEHFVWNYVYYLIYIRIKNKLDYTGMESYVDEKFNNEDLSWFPIQRALSLVNSDKEEEEDVKAMVEEKLQAVQKKILDTIATTGNNQQMMQMGNLQLNASRLKSRARKANHRGTYMVNQ